MMHLAPHLLLHANTGPSQVAMLLGAAGYVVSKIDDGALAERLAGAPHIDGIVVELPALAAIHFGRRLNARYGAGSLVTLIITRAAATTRRELPSVSVLTPFEAADDLITTIDLALARTQRPLSPDHRESPRPPRIRVA